MHRSRKWNESGVSEVVGTILILLMTVALFASIVIWVTSFPTPPSSVRLDMDGTLSPIYDSGNNWDGANITVVHRGGERLLNFRTNVFLTVETGSGSETEVLRNRGVTGGGMDYGIAGPDAEWDAGESWTYTNYTIEATDRVSLTVVDTIRSVILWNEPLKGPTGTHPPLFVEKWVDGDTGTTFTRDVAVTGKTFALYAQVVDQDGDLNRGSVNATLTFGGAAQGIYRMYDDGTHGDRIANDGVFSRTDAGWNPAKSWDGGIILLEARDAENHLTTSRLILEVREGPGGSGGGGGGQGPLDLLHKNEFQAYAIYNETEWDTNKWGANETRIFVKGEVLVAVVASQYLKNIESLNEFMLYDPDDVPQSPVVYGGQSPGEGTTPSCTSAFSFLEFVSGFYVYEYRFTTQYDASLLQMDPYHLEIDLRASNVDPPRNRFSTVDVITVTDDSRDTSNDYPVIEFFKDSAFQFKSDPPEFEFTETMYVRIKVGSAASPVTAGDLVISDFIGGTQVWAAPGIPPVSSISVADTTHYSFTVDLSAPNGDPWVIGRNSYGFRLKWIRDSNEDYTLSAQIAVNGPRWRLDIGSALNEFSHPNFDQRWYAVLHENDRLWTQYLIQKWDSGPGNSDPPWGAGPFNQIVFADFDEDTDLDAVTALEAGEIFVYRNVLGDGHEWTRTQVKDHGSARVRAVAAGLLDSDTDYDIVAGLDDGRLFWYSNEGGTWREEFIEDLGTNEIKAIKIGKGDADQDRDIFVATGSVFRVYYNTPFATPMFSNSNELEVSVGATVYDLVVADVGTDNTVTTPDGKNDVVVARGSVGSGSSANTAVMIFWSSNYAFSVTKSLTVASGSGQLAYPTAVDVGHLNADSLLDVVGGTSDGIVYRWLNNDWARDDLGVGLGEVRALRVADVDGDSLEDIVVASKDGSGATQNGWIRWLRRTGQDAGGANPPNIWVAYVVYKVTNTNAAVYDIDVGDVDRGVRFDRAL